MMDKKRGVFWVGCNKRHDGSLEIALPKTKKELAAFRANPEKWSANYFGMSIREYRRWANAAINAQER
jgi:hypothetical protein